MAEMMKFYLLPEVGQGIPFDVIGSLIRAVGLLWPGAEMGPGRHEFGGVEGISIIIPAVDRAKPLTKAAAKKIKQHRDDYTEDSGVIGYDGKTITATSPDDYRQRLAHWAYMMLTQSEGAINYVEQEVTAPDGRRFVVTAAWSGRQTPHALREAAEKRAEVAEARVAELEATR